MRNRLQRAIIIRRVVIAEIDGRGKYIGIEAEIAGDRSSAKKYFLSLLWQKNIKHHEAARFLMNRCREAMGGELR